MLSQVRRLLPSSFALGTLIDSSTIVLASSARFSSKNDSNDPTDKSTKQAANMSKTSNTPETPKHPSNSKDAIARKGAKVRNDPKKVGDSKASMQLSGRKMKGDTSPSNDPLAGVIDEITSKKSGAPRKVNFENTRKEQAFSKENISRMKPGQLNVKMVQAAKNVAAQAKGAEQEVFDDLLAKIDDVFGMENKGRRKVQKRESNQRSDNSSTGGAKQNIPAQKGKRYDDVDELGALGDLGTPGVLENVFQSAPRPRGQRITQDSENRSIVLIPEKSFGSEQELLNSVQPLGIFSPDMKLSSESPMKFWEKFELAEIDSLSKHAPLNWFDQCIQWTNEGKLWHFPIDNEQGMDEEAKVDFTEHIFLDHYIESWCPQDGPLRHFMELVLVGLSKNPFYSVTEKKNIIEWYRQYFTKHQALLEELNVLGSIQNPIPVDGKLN